MLVLRPFIEQLSVKINRKKVEILELSDDEWTEYERAVAVLKVPYEATLQMQAVQYTLSDFFATWLDVKIKLRTFTESKLAESIINGMEIREQKKSTISSPPMIACVFMDARYRSLLDSGQTLIAIEHLTRLYRKVRSVNATENELVPVDFNPAECSSLKQYLINKEKVRKNSSSLFCANDANALRRIEIITPNNTNFHESTLLVWSRFQTYEPHLYKLACVVNAAAPTQISVESGFSSLSFILNPYRTQLNDEHVNNILLIRLNKSLLNSISFDFDNS